MIQVLSDRVLDVIFGVLISWTIMFCLPWNGPEYPPF